MAEGQKRLLKVEDMERLEYVSSPAVHPNGQLVVYSVYKADKQQGTYPVSLFGVSAKGGQPGGWLLLDSRANVGEAPAFSPDGRYLSVLGMKDEEKQIFIYDLSELEVVFNRSAFGSAPDIQAVSECLKRQSPAVSTLRHGVSRYLWSPDSRSLVFETRAWTEEDEGVLFCEMTAGERAQFLWEAENMPVATEELMYKFDETFGCVDGSRRQVGIWELEKQSMRLISDRSRHADHPAWSNGSDKIAYYKYIYDRHEATKCELFIVDLVSGKEHQLTKESYYLGKDTPVFLPGDKALMYTAMEKEDKGFILKLLKAELDGSQPRNMMTGQMECQGVNTLWDGITQYGMRTPDYQAVQNSEGDLAGVYFLSTWQGYTSLFYLDNDGDVKPVIQGLFSIRNFCLPVDGKIVYTRQDGAGPDQVWLRDLEAGTDVCLTGHNQWLEEVSMPLQQELWVDSLDGKTKIHGWVLPPADYMAGKEPVEKKPCVLYIHGGPEVCWTYGWWHEFQLLSAAGLGVIYCDPRGSMGFGTAHIDGPYAWGQAAMDDLMGFVEAAGEQFPFLDTERLGITGGSYGGYMTVKLTGRKGTRFKAAVGQRVLCNPATSYGTGDLGFISSSSSKPASFKAYIEDRTKGNPMTYIDQMKVPFLVLHGMKDYRCSAEQAEQLFSAMKDRNPEIPVRMVLFPDENHGITREGRITSRMRHVEEMVSWLKKYLYMDKDWSKAAAESQEREAGNDNE